MSYRDLSHKINRFVNTYALGSASTIEYLHSVNWSDLEDSSQVPSAVIAMRKMGKDLARESTLKTVGQKKSE